MSDNQDYFELAYQSIHCFSSEGVLMLDQLETIMKIVLRDGLVDDREKRILKMIFSKANEQALSEPLTEKIKQIRDRCGLH